MAEHLPDFESFGTDAVHAGQDPEQWNSWAVIPPISLSTTFKQPTPGKPLKYEYSRGGNPTRDCLEAAFAKISGAKFGLAFSAGLAATNAILGLLSIGDHVVAMNDLYGGTNRMFRRIAMKNGLQFDFVDATKAENVARAIRPNTKLVWIETPTNPLLQVCDIAAIAAAVNKHPGVILAVDNTFMSPCCQRPLSLGAHIEFNSVTKYINGHSDVIMGCVMLNDEAIYEKLKFLQFAVGSVPSPFDCFLVNRGIKTLHLRMKQSSESAMALSIYLSRSPKVLSVLYPGLLSHPSHSIAKKQCTMFSGMLSFRIKGGIPEAENFLKACEVFCLAESLGGIESLCEHPALMTHASIVKEERERLGITDNLIRLSVGVEDVLDLLTDVDQALNAAIPNGPANQAPHEFLAALYGGTLDDPHTAVFTKDYIHSSPFLPHNLAHQQGKTTTTTTTTSTSSSSNNNTNNASTLNTSTISSEIVTSSPSKQVSFSSLPPSSPSKQTQTQSSNYTTTTTVSSPSHSVTSPRRPGTPGTPINPAFLPPAGQRRQPPGGQSSVFFG